VTTPPANPPGSDLAIAWTADRVFDGHRVLEDHAVVVMGGSVTRLVPRATLPPGMPVYREPGTTILPGLVDTHIHLMGWELPLFLAYGVTTVRDTGNDLAWILDQRRRATTPQGRPRILCLGPILDGARPNHPLVSRSCVDSEGVISAVRNLASVEVDGVKLYVGFPTELLPLAVRESHAAALKVSKHCLADGVLIAGRAGVDEFFHLDGILADVWPDHPPGWLSIWGLPGMHGTLDAQQRVADEIARLQMVSTPTLAYWDSQWRIRSPGRSSEEDSPQVPLQLVDWQGTAARNQADADQWRRALEAALRFTGFLLERGVSTLAGTDVPCGALPAGLSLWREMSLLVESGMPTIGALQSATSAAGAFLGQPQLGWLGPGSAADLVVVRGNPTERVPQVPELVAVLCAGVLYHPAELLKAARQGSEEIMADPWAGQFKKHREAAR